MANLLEPNDQGLLSTRNANTIVSQLFFSFFQKSRNATETDRIQLDPKFEDIPDDGHGDHVHEYLIHLYDILIPTIIQTRWQSSKGNDLSNYNFLDEHPGFDWPSGILIDDLNDQHGIWWMSPQFKIHIQIYEVSWPMLEDWGNWHDGVL